MDQSRAPLIGPHWPRKIDFKPILSQEERNIIASLKREEINGIAKLLLAAELIQIRQIND